MSKPTVVIICGGASSRLFPLNLRNKAYLKLFGAALISRTVANLQIDGFENFVLVVPQADEGGQQLLNLLKNDGVDVTKIKITIQPEAKGMGDAVLQAKQYLTDRFFVLYPYHINVATALNQSLAKKESAVICSITTDNPWNYGIITLKDNRAIGLIEKPTSGDEPSNQKVSLYLLNQEFLKILTALPEAEYNFEDALNQLMQTSEVGVTKLDESPVTLKYPWHLFDIQSYFFSQLKSHRGQNLNIAPTAVIDETKGSVWIDDNVVIGHCAHIVGPVYLGKDVKIGDFTLIRESSIESESKIGSHTDLVRSIILSKTSIHYSYVGDSIIGNEINVGAGLLTGNKRLDGQNVKVDVKGQKIDSLHRKLGVIIGDHANLGIGVKTMPGVCLGVGSVIFPNQTIFNNVDHRAVLKTQH
jgi:bifunctional UDP-N-acetylglucosamine pyrophosphorylase/glucosamine-1-phosphate N-acetyltransferase